MKKPALLKQAFSFIYNFMIVACFKYQSLNHKE